ncbi:hypothetical protein L915_16915 [Phytophthora nicotianae]|uniref:Uncharacterized protein n=1 Tax=Phytophthora nicotianae TaxID=4792 RepID=W2G380_PHYNI|nr:hypothetical protein L915_16915 [Phytophthora nicotianae]
MERLGQPMLGWTVNLNSQTCRCRAFYRFGACMLAPLKRANWKIAGWPETERRFVDRRVKRSKLSTGAKKKEGHLAFPTLFAWTRLDLCL